MWLKQESFTWNNLISAGTLSPTLIVTISPGTSSRARNVSSFPSRIQWHFGGTSFFSSCRDFSDLEERRENFVVISDDRHAGRERGMR